MVSEPSWGPYLGQGTLKWTEIGPTNDPWMIWDEFDTFCNDRFCKLKPEYILKGSLIFLECRIFIQNKNSCFKNHFYKIRPGILFVCRFFLLGHILKGPNKHLVVNLCTAINDYSAVYTQAVKVGNIFVKILDPVFGDLAKFYLRKFKESGASVKREAHCHQHRGCKTLCKETSSGRKKRGVGTDTAQARCCTTKDAREYL